MQGTYGGWMAQKRRSPRLIIYSERARHDSDASKDSLCQCGTRHLELRHRLNTSKYLCIQIYKCKDRLNSREFIVRSTRVRCDPGAGAKMVGPWLQPASNDKRITTSVRLCLVSQNLWRDGSKQHKDFMSTEYIFSQGGQVRLVVLFIERYRMILTLRNAKGKFLFS